MSPTESEKVLDKIRATLRKAEEGRNVHEEERDTAMRMANRLLLKHGLSMADVGDASEKDGRSFEHEGYLSVDGDLDEWKGQLLYSLSSIYFCKSYRIPTSKKGGRHVLLGRASNVAACKMMYEFVEPQLQGEFNLLAAQMGLYWRIARRYCIAAWLQTQGVKPPSASSPCCGARTEEEDGEFFCLDCGRLVDEVDANIEMPIDEELAAIGKERLDGYPSREMRALDIMELAGLDSLGYAKNAIARVNAGEIAPHDTDNLGVWRRSFFDAAVSRVSSRLRELMREEVEDLGAPGTELVKNEKADLQAFLDSLDLGLHSHNSSRQHDSAGASQGDAAGKRADISGHRKVSRVQKQLNS